MKDNVIEYSLISKEVSRVIWEPGDCTRYEFLVIRDYDDFLICPYKSTFKFPNKLNMYDIKNTVEKFPEISHHIQEMAEELYKSEDVNPHTTVQVARAIYKLYNLEHL